MKLIAFGRRKEGEGKKLALATIIHTTGSSYRKKGAQMIIAEDLAYEGALSGGCVEKEVVRQAAKVFVSKKNATFEYDGRYKLGCNGIISILIEYLDSRVLQLLSQNIHDYHRTRKTFHLGIRKSRDLSNASLYYSFDGNRIDVSPWQPVEGEEKEEIVIHPQYQLVIIGGEFDSVILANLADGSGMQTLLVVKESFTADALPATVKVAYLKPEALVTAVRFDEHTAIVLMTHSLSKDLSYLIEMVKVRSGYMGILGPPSRREIIMNDLMNYSDTFFMAHQDKLESVHGPVGLDIGAKNAGEIGIAILADIIAVFNHRSIKAVLEKA